WSRDHLYQNVGQPLPVICQVDAEACWRTLFFDEWRGCKAFALALSGQAQRLPQAGGMDAAKVELDVAHGHGLGPLVMCFIWCEALWAKR
ncbi:hypothetical protein, partial [Pseudomonas sp. NPDC008258]|uniref:hypothetical protein n=1 Tax=Pseudomonas sp. NPDC008258 TaxID=3364418 RepID=UPI0036E99063